MMPLLVIGVGHRYRHDDGVGLVVAEALQARALPGVEVVLHHGEGTGLMALWERAEDVVLIDAVRSGAAAGTIHRVVGAVPRRLAFHSSHAFGPAEAIALAAALGRLPARFAVYGIEAAEFSAGEGLTPAVAAAATALTAELAATLAG